MNEQTKKLLWLILVIFAFGATIFFGYQFFTVATPQDTIGGEEQVSGFPVTPEIETIGETPVSEEELKSKTIGVSEETAGKLTQVAEFSVVGPSLNQNGDKISFFEKNGGNLWTANFDGTNREKISNITVIGMFEAIWSPKKDRVAIFYVDKEIKKGFLLTDGASVAVLPQNIYSFSWSQTGNSLAYTLIEGNKISLITADSSAEKPKTIFNTLPKDGQIKWITNDLISINTAPSGLAQGFNFLYSREKGTLSKIMDSFGISTLWSPDGKKALVSSTDSNGKLNNLKINGVLGEELFASEIKTIPEKCVWLNSDKIYCAVPRIIPPKSVWPDDYLLGSLHTIDSIVVIDIKNEEIREIFDEGLFDMSDLLVTQNEDYIFFVNRTDGTLWSLKLN